MNGNRPRLPLSVLDQSPIAEGSGGADALQRTLDLARTTEALGYTRYWVAEHHGAEMLAGASPEVLIAAIAAQTSDIRVGSGGVMLPHYSPYKVAEVFSTLSGLFPGRIDLGVGRAAGTDRATARVLQRDRRQAPPDDFPDQLAELVGYYRRGGPVDDELTRLRLLPGRPEQPTPWLLGSSPQSGIWAARLGLPYAFADFISPTGMAVARRYRHEFRPSSALPAPHVVVAVSVVCAETDAEAEQLASSARMLFTLFLQGVLIPVPPVATALRYVQEQAANVAALGTRRRLIVGAPATVRTALEAVVADYQADELMLVTIVYDHDARLRSYALLADAFGLEPRASREAAWAPQ
jgi:luciferase family oxidoreductase group 1